MVRDQDMIASTLIRVKDLPTPYLYRLVEIRESL
jgi:hypothetical protein